MCGTTPHLTLLPTRSISEHNGLNTPLVGTAGWSVDRSLERFAGEGTALERYASVFRAVEINSSFYRRHRPSTWQRWHDAVPDQFRFSVKLPKTITHERQLTNSAGELDLFFGDIKPLAAKLGAILVQLPPKLQFDAATAETFLAAIRARTRSPIFIEPRHISWAHEQACRLLEQFSIGRVYADPQKPELQFAPTPEKPCYLRLHGSPKIYYSPYSDESLAQYARLLAGHPGSWCIFDNTASGAAIRDALKLLDLSRAGLGSH
jgi:uncharacterized protein YecE (DUF72 family)